MDSATAKYLLANLQKQMQAPGNMEPHGPTQAALYSAVIALLNHFIAQERSAP